MTQFDVSLIILTLPGMVSSELPHIVQEPSSLTVYEGESITLLCVINTLYPRGPLKLFQQVSNTYQFCYSFNNVFFHRVTSIADTTQRDKKDFSIHVFKLTTEDEGIYYCTKWI